MENKVQSEWACDLTVAQDLWLENFGLFVNELQKMYGDTYGHLNSAIEAMQE